MVKEQLEKLVQKVDTLGMRLWGNRVFFGSLVLLTASYFTPDLPQDASTPEITAYLGAYLGMYVPGCMGCGITMFGQSTPKYYKRTMKHIKENGGKLDVRFAEKLIDRSENGRFIGYCQQQGLYLAARNTGNLDVFEEARAVSNIKIPFF